jgi:LacI family transcriptional regulator
MGVTVTINDVARLANVSKASVSYVINNKPGVSEATRKKILDVMAELNYRPNPIARGLAGQSMGMIGMAIPDISDMFYARIIRGVEKEVNTHDFILNLCTTHGHHTREKDIVDLLSSGRVDGLLLMTYFLEETQLQELSAKGLPFVLINCPPSQYENPYSSILIDHYRGAVIGTEYLIKCGHKDIAFIHGSSISKDNEQRFEGFKDTLKQYGLELNPDYVGYGDYKKEGGYEAALKLLELPKRPTAVFAANDQMALGVLDACRDKGVGVPEDLSVLGFDDIEASQYVKPSLTTLRQPTEAMGAAAVQLLFAMLDGKQKSPKTMALQPKLKIRQSVCKI